MFVYLARFEKRKGLCKIGVAKEVRSRLTQLEACHGPVESFQKFKIGKGYVRLEKFIHERFAESRADLPKCDGFTEFFKDEVEAEAVQVLSTMALTLTEAEVKRAAEEQAQLSPAIRTKKLALAAACEAVVDCERDIEAVQKFIANEHMRLKKFMVRLVNDRSAMEYEVAEYSQIVFGNGYYILHMSGALELGFPKEDVVRAVYNKMKDEGRRRVTCGRIRLAYDMWVGSSGYGEGGNRKLSDAKKSAVALREKLKKLKKKKDKLEVKNEEGVE